MEQHICGAVLKILAVVSFGSLCWCWLYILLSFSFFFFFFHIFTDNSKINFNFTNSKSHRHTECGDAPIIFVAATLRPETMYGQTNCFILPEGQYGAYKMNNGEIFIMSSHAADNICHQAQEINMTSKWGESDFICQVTGMDLMGLPLKAPNATYDCVYTLPLLTISMTKGTGIVTSVPSDAPDGKCI